jgi:hypothetical protein
MDYNQINIFLDKFKNIISKKEEFKNIVVETIEKEIHHEIDKNTIGMKKGFIYLKCSPILKSEIMIHKKQILEKLKNLFPNNNFLDIK